MKPEFTCFNCEKPTNDDKDILHQMLGHHGGENFNDKKDIFNIIVDRESPFFSEVLYNPLSYFVSYLLISMIFNCFMETEF